MPPSHCLPPDKHSSLRPKRLTEFLDFSQPLLFNKYAGNASDITKIEVTYSITIKGGQFVIDNDADSPATVTARFGAELQTDSTVPLLTSSFQPIVSNASATNSGTFNLAPNQGDGLGDYDGSGPDGAILAGQTVTKSDSGLVGSMFYGSYAGAEHFKSMRSRGKSPALAQAVVLRRLQLRFPRTDLSPSHTPLCPSLALQRFSASAPQRWPSAAVGSDFRFG